MKNKIIIELRAAINVSGNNFLPLCHGEKRIQQYVDGLSQFYKHIKHFENCDIIFATRWNFASEKKFAIL